jgi:biopolymer transport protein ExbD
MRRANAADAAADPQNDINLTPMLDVVFIMLIFFLVVASFVKETGLDVSKSDSVNDASPDDSNILVMIDAEDGIWLENRLIDPRALRANIERLNAESSAAGLVIQPDRHSANETFVQVMDASRQAGIYNISLAAEVDRP